MQKLEKNVLAELPNSKRLELHNKYQHLKDLETNGNDTKTVSPVHMILGVNNYTKIKTHEKLGVGLDGEPVAELTKLGLVVILPGNSNEVTILLFSKASLYD